MSSTAITCLTASEWDALLKEYLEYMKDSQFPRKPLIHKVYSQEEWVSS